VDVDLSQLTDYPPKFSIYAHCTRANIDSLYDSPQLVVRGLDTEEYTFKITIPGEFVSDL
jgi:hypothetical protein